MFFSSNDEYINTRYIPPQDNESRTKVKVFTRRVTVRRSEKKKKKTTGEASPIFYLDRLK